MFEDEDPSDVAPVQVQDERAIADETASKSSVRDEEPTGNRRDSDTDSSSDDEEGSESEGGLSLSPPPEIKGQKHRGPPTNSVAGRPAQKAPRKVAPKDQKPAKQPSQSDQQKDKSKDKGKGGDKGGRMFGFLKSS